MSLELIEGDFTASVESAWVLATLRTIYGARAWSGAVPAEVKLPRDGKERVFPYFVVRFGTPFASTQGRGIAGGEQEQPHIWRFTLVAHAGDDDWAKEALADASRLLTGHFPSLTSEVLRVTGGGALGGTNETATPQRFDHAATYRTTINL